MIIIITIFLMGIIGLIAAILLNLAAKKFYVKEDARKLEIEELLPGANCGACGYSGCQAFAQACCKTTSLEGFYCPGAGPEGMQKIAEILGLTAEDKQPEVAFIRCNGKCEYRHKRNRYEGIKSCAFEATQYSDVEDCAYGCLGCGDCVSVCPYDAIKINDISTLPEVDLEKCVGCGKCMDACPRQLIELIKRKELYVWVACRNRDKGALAMKECEVSCIGCGKCIRVCPTHSIGVKEFVAHIDQNICTSCQECVEVCPRHSILTKKN